MLTLALEAAIFGTNCYLLAPARGEECLIVDPGIGVEDAVMELLREHRLKPAGVLLTHGHIDHVYSVTPVCGGDAAAYIHSADTYRLTNPLAGLPPQLIAAMEQQFGRSATWREPDHVIEVSDRERLSLAGLDLEVIHAPGHTEGSAMFALDQVPDRIHEALPASQQVDRTLISGDVLFAGSIGRTDLPGGDSAAMTTSLRDKVLPLADSTLVLAGHGPATTMRQERATNPYLQGLNPA